MYTFYRVVLIFHTLIIYLQDTKQNTNYEHFL